MLITVSKLCSFTSSNGRNTLQPEFTRTPSRCPNSRLIIANIVSRSVRLLTSARTARLPARSVFLARLERALIQPADGDARALSVEFLRCGQSDPAVAAYNQDVLVREPTHCRHSFR